MLVIVGWWWCKIVGFVLLFDTTCLGIHALFLPSLHFTVGCAISPLKESALTLGTFKVETMHVLGRFRQGEDQGFVAAASHGRRIVVVRSGGIHGMKGVF